MMTQAWVWHFTKTDGSAVDEPVSPAFTTQFDAEKWLGSRWRSLVKGQIASAHLMNGGLQATPTLDLVDAMQKSTAAQQPSTATGGVTKDIPRT